MKKVIISIILNLICYTSHLQADHKGVDIEITLAGSQGGSSSSLNSLTKLKDKGKSISRSNGKVNYEISNSFEIKKNENGELILTVDLILKKNGQGDMPWSKTIEISNTGKIKFKPFDGIEMTVDSNGFPSTS